MSGVALYGALVMAGLAVLQSTVLRFVEIAGVSTDLILIVLIFLANKNGAMTGQVSGFVAGVILDLMGLAPLGFYALIYTLLGALFGITRGKMFVDPLFIPVILSVVAMVLKGLVALLVAALFSIAAIQGRLFASSYLIEIVYTGLVGPVVFGLLGMIPWLQPDRRRGELA
ncbi:MAG: rod shape-determining protein MreD [Spirochaetota bacterium]